MDSMKILKKLNLIETFRLDIGNKKSKIFSELKLITDMDNRYFTEGVDKSKKKYVGQVGTDFFNIKPIDTYYSQLNVCARGKIFEGKDKTELEIEINGFHKKPGFLNFPSCF